MLKKRSANSGLSLVEPGYALQQFDISGDDPFFLLNAIAPTQTVGEATFDMTADVSDTGATYNDVSEADAAYNEAADDDVLETGERDNDVCETEKTYGE